MHKDSLTYPKEYQSYYERMDDWVEIIEEILDQALDSEEAYMAPIYAWDMSREDTVCVDQPSVPDLAVTAQRRLAEAMRYVLLAPGKRVRPILFMAARELLGANGTVTDIDRRFIAAVEMIHNYSLVHDDLPAMDDDDLRRGRLTCHRAFDEATAILAGDALLTRALELVIEAVTFAEDEAELHRVLQAAGLLAERAGTRGMIGGQIIDLMAEEQSIPTIDSAQFASASASLEQIQWRKTAALLEAPMLCAALIYDAPQELFAHIRAYARGLGRAYQMQDDYLDADGKAETIGKTPGKDAGAGKWTEVTLYGTTDRSRLEAVIQSVEAACDAFERLGYDAKFLRKLARSTVQRVK